MYFGQEVCSCFRGCYFVFTYFMLFYNMFIGIGSVLLRIGKSMVLGTLILSRLDYSILPRKFEFLDPGKLPEGL